MREWNELQKRAIDASGSIVVSAAAGSGKTSVLAERVLSLIKQGSDIERMLIVTFTNLAAGEMKERIYQRLSEEGKSDLRLAAQAEKCAFADISTIHAFCGQVVRDNFEYAGASPAFSVADEAGIKILKQRAMTTVTERASQDKQKRVFIEKFSNRGDMQRIKDIVFSIYNRVISLKEPGAWLQNALSNFDSGQFIYILFGEYKNMLLEASREASAHLSDRSDIWRMRGFVHEAVISESQRLEMLQAVKEITMDNVCLPFIEHIRADTNGAPNRDSATHTNRANKALSELEAYSGDFRSKVSLELQSARKDAGAFIEVTRDFMDEYKALKKRRNVLDHDDLIHFALKALRTKEIAQRYRDKYEHVFVDEYQDINDVQNAILKKITRAGNDFLVGDVKQCIYMFRESNPDLLIKRCAELSGSGLVEMNINYRSTPEVIDFINGIMKHMMDEAAGGVSYTGGQKLKASKQGGGCVDIVVAGEDPDSLSAESGAIAAYIKQLTHQGYKYSDIAVLRPELSTTGGNIARMLSELGIPVAGGTGDSDRRFDETAVFINLLSLIESPVSDIALLSVMRYPHFGFTEPELAKIRICHQNKERTGDSFYDAVCSYNEKSGLKTKIDAFLEEIEHYRKLSECMKLPDFLMRLRQEA